MDEARIEYKCRRCGKIEQNHIMAEEFGQLWLIAAIRGDSRILPERLRGSTPTMERLHFCSPDVVGIADLIGYSVRKT